MKFHLTLSLCLAGWTALTAPPKRTQDEVAAFEFYLGLSFYRGVDAAPDYTTALNHFRQSASKGYASAQGMLGQCYLQGRGVAPNPAQAAKWLTLAANQNDSIAQFHLALLHARGQGVPKNEKKAFDLYLAAAAQGHTAAMGNIGVLYETGRGVARDYTKAFKWYSMAAKPGLAVAQCNLGRLYATGRGVEANPTKAAEWYLAAANQGHAEAQFLLGTVYYFGKGLAKDRAKAYQWMSLAARQGHTLAQRHVKTISQNLSEEEFTQANRATTAFLDKEKAKINSSPKIDLTRSATGFFITPRGHILTANHTISNAKTIHIHTPQGRHTARVIRTDAQLDLAVLQVEVAAKPLHLNLINQGLNPSREVFTLGYPVRPKDRLEAQLTAGKVTALTGPARNTRLITLNIPVQNGNAGGPVVNDQGMAVGMISVAASNAPQSDIPRRLSYAVKTTPIVDFLSRIPEVRLHLPLRKPGFENYTQAIQAAQKATVLIVATP